MESLKELKDKFRVLRKQHVDKADEYIKEGKPRNFQYNDGFADGVYECLNLLETFETYCINRAVEQLNYKGDPNKC